MLLSSSYPSFSKKELHNIKKTSGSIAKNRAEDYQNNIRSYKTIGKEKQLLKVNFYLNQLLSQYDSVIQKREDYWATPKEFLLAGYGDCEDYVIIKYFTLLKLGFDENKLYFTTVYEKYTGGYHMVLSYFQTKDKSPLILDNLSFRILSLKAREDLKADVFINSNGMFKIGKKNKLYKTHTSNNKFKSLIYRIKKED